MIDNVRAHYTSCDIGAVLRNTEFLDEARLAENWLRVLNILTAQSLRARLQFQGVTMSPLIIINPAHTTEQNI